MNSYYISITKLKSLPALIFSLFISVVKFSCNYITSKLTYVSNLNFTYTFSLYAIFNSAILGLLFFGQLYFSALLKVYILGYILDLTSNIDFNSPTLCISSMLIFPKLNLKSYKKRFIFIFLALLLAFSYIMLKSSIMLNIFILWFGIIQFVALLHNFKPLSEYFQPLIRFIIQLLFDMKILNASFYVYSYFHFVLKTLPFKVYLFILYTLTFCFFICTRYVLYAKIYNLPISLSLSSCFFLLSFILIVRSFQQFSLFIIPFCFNHYENIGNHLLRSGDISTPPYFGGIFNRHSHSHYYPPDPHRSSLNRYGMLFVGGATLILTGYIAVLQVQANDIARTQYELARAQYELARAQNELATVQNNEFARQNNLEELSLKIIPFEVFMERTYPDDWNKLSNQEKMTRAHAYREANKTKE